MYIIYKSITSRDNSVVKLAASVAKGDTTNGLMLLEGEKLLNDAVKNNLKVEYAFFQDNGKYEDLAFSLPEETETFFVTESIMEKITDTKTPSGIVSLVKRPQIYSVSDIETGKYLIIDSIQDPKNVGAIFRVANAFSLDGILIFNTNADIFSPKTTRGAMGSNLRVKCFNLSCKEEIEILIDKKFNFYASVLNNSATSINKINFSDKSVVIIGNEGKGISKELLDISNKSLFIPMSGNTESLNASVAAGIIVWEMTKNK